MYPNIKFKCTTVKSSFAKFWRWHENVENSIINWKLPFLYWELLSFCCLNIHYWLSCTGWHVHYWPTDYQADSLTRFLTDYHPWLLDQQTNWWTAQVTTGNLLLSDSLSIHDCLTDRNGWLTYCLNVWPWLCDWQVYQLTGWLGLLHLKHWHWLSEGLNRQSDCSKTDRLVCKISYFFPTLIPSLKSPVKFTSLFTQSAFLTPVSLPFLAGDEVLSAYTQQKYEVLDVGIMHPGEVSTGAL